ncbi:MAG TPA: sugar ABC transporter permease [Anaerolineae bacterium]|nr:sugar ABC transporter permease [Anaerolineae bacterium]
MSNDSRPRPAAFDRRFLRRFTADWGPLPIVLALIVLWIIFWLANDKFLSPLNLTNLMLQIAALGTLATGIVLVLLLGELDLSAAMVSGLGAAIMSSLNVRNGLPGPLALLAGIGVGTLIGLFQGIWITKLRIPSFIVTLAGFIAWQGALLWMVGNTGSISLRDPFILGIAGTFFTEVWIGLTLGAVLVAGYAFFLFLDRRRQLRANLSAPAPRALLLRVALIAAIILAALAAFYANRGLPLAVVIFIGLVIVVDGVTRRTIYGRHIYAVGGNAEAARRAGIQVDRIRISIFALASTIASVAGILAASRLSAVNLASGSSDLLLNAIAAAIIGGASLFGGRGSAWSGLLGALVIGSISNGTDLLAYDVSSRTLTSLKFFITAIVLLATVTIEVVSRRRRETAG